MHILLTDRSSTTHKTRQPIPQTTTQPDIRSTLPRPADPWWKRAIAALGGAFILFCWLFLAVWVFAIITTDNFLLGQYLYWFNPALVLAAGGFLLAGWVLKRLGDSGNRTPRKAARRAAAVFVLAFILLCARELGVIRSITNLTAASPPKGQCIRVVHWNLSVFEVAERINIGDNLAAEGTPDIAFISMQNNHRLWQQVTDGMKGATKDEITLARIGPEKVFTRFPVSFTEVFRVSFTGKDEPAVPVAPPLLRKSLAALFRALRLQDRTTDEIEDATIIGLTFDTTARLGRVTNAWFIDMPSHPLASRADMVKRVVTRATALQKAGLLPAPDFIAGDFNIPIGSASLKTFAPGFHPASDTAGLGRLASWPRPNAMLQIDHILVSAKWHVSDYRLLDPGASEHMAQTAILWPADTSPAPGAPK